MAFFGLRAFRKASPAVLAKYIRVLLLGIMGVALLYLTATGRLNWFFALLGVAIAFMLRLMPALLHYAPQLHRLWQEFSGAKQNSSQRQSDASAKGKMSVEEAYEVLGLKPVASEQDIIAAHRKLMQKIHPDRGGSDYLAAKINLAKKILLKK
jgi:DnaJ domain